ncbi:MAG TPA: hypothetical protein VF405_12545 [Gammaproteobacteria bacterium]
MIPDRGFGNDGHGEMIAVGDGSRDRPAAKTTNTAKKRASLEAAGEDSIVCRVWTSTQVEDIELATEPVATEMPMEARIARIEADVAHLRSDVGDIKDDVRSLRDRMEAKFDAVTAALAVLKDSIAGTRSDLATVKGALETDIASVKGALETNSASAKGDITTVRSELAAAVASLKGEIATFKSEVTAAIASVKVWAVLLYLALAAGMFGTMARGFGWL